MSHLLLSTLGVAMALVIAAAGIQDAPVHPLAPRAEAYLQAYAEGDFEALGACLAADATFEDGVMQLKGREQVVAGLTAAFETMDIESLDLATRIHSGAQHVLYQGTVRFTQEGASLGVPGKMFTFEVPIGVTLKFDEHGKVLRHVDYVDTPAYMEQFGAQVREGDGR